MATRTRLLVAERVAKAARNLLLAIAKASLLEDENLLDPDKYAENLQAQSRAEDDLEGALKEWELEL